jgi:3-oxoacyl-[acyl-carrier protein] reductase
MRLDGKVCVVTGAARGIGRCIAELFAEAGAKTVIACDIKVEALHAAGLPQSIVAEQLDVTDSAAVASFAARVKERHGRIDVLVNNAGITRDALLQKMTDADWSAVIAVNLTGAFLMTRAVAPFMMEAGAGAIVSIASVVGIDGNVGQTNYAATKAGIIGMTRTWAKELARSGAKVRANAVAPGYINTPMVQAVPQKVVEAITARVVLGRLGEPMDVAQAVLFLASDASAYITGQVIRVDGGLVL